MSAVLALPTRTVVELDDQVPVLALAAALACYGLTLTTVRPGRVRIVPFQPLAPAPAPPGEAA